MDLLSLPAALLQKLVYVDLQNAISITVVFHTVSSDEGTHFTAKVWQWTHAHKHSLVLTCSPLSRNGWLDRTIECFFEDCYNVC